MSDQMLHFLVFTAFGAGLFRFWRQPALFVVVLLLGYGMLIELLQTLVPGRESGVDEALADAVGIFVALLAVMVARSAKGSHPGGRSR